MNRPGGGAWSARRQGSIRAPDCTETLYFEDFTVGRVFEWSGLTVSEESIIEFGALFDPVAAAKSKNVLDKKR